MSATTKRKPGGHRAFVEAERHDNSALAREMQAPRWTVSINGKLFGRYATRAGALAIVRSLRGHGMHAVVVEVV